MTNPTGGEWLHEGQMIYSEQGIICELSEPRRTRYIRHYPIDIGSRDWNEAMANGKLIVEAVKAYRQILRLFGPNWENELKRLEEAAREL